MSPRPVTPPPPVTLPVPTPEELRPLAEALVALLMAWCAAHPADVAAMLEEERHATA